MSIGVSVCAMRRVGTGSGLAMGDVAFMILGLIEMCQRPVGSAFQRRTLRRYQAS